ncbi:MAG: hypothetical protein AMXMBFR82_07250 [Candidatus Hydrogenedentota bacterium]
MFKPALCGRLRALVLDLEWRTNVNRLDIEEIKRHVQDYYRDMNGMFPPLTEGNIFIGNKFAKWSSGDVEKAVEELKSQGYVRIVDHEGHYPSLEITERGIAEWLS